MALPIQVSLLFLRFLHYLMFKLFSLGVVRFRLAWQSSPAFSVVLNSCWDPH